MAISPSKVRLQTVVHAELAQKIDELASRMGCSQSKMIELLLDAAVQDQEWIVRAASSNFARRLASKLQEPAEG
jgi:predicted transcriptional regulator